MNKFGVFGSVSPAVLAAAATAFSMQSATAQQVNCITQSSNGFFGSSSSTQCFVGPNRKEIGEGETIVIDGITYHMTNGRVQVKKDYAQPSVDQRRNCTVESYADTNGAGSRVVCR